jgi:hypothetical protein
LTSDAFSLGVAAHGVALLSIGIQIGAGARLLDWFGLRDELTSHERVLFGWAAGFSLTTALWMGLAGAGLLGPVAVLAISAALAVMGWPVARELSSKGLSVVRTLDPAPRLAVGLGLLVMCVWVSPLLVETLLPNSDWDSELYHLPLADRFAAGTLWGRDPYFPAFSFPGAVQLGYAALLAVGFEAAITPQNFYVAILTLLTTVAVARQIGGRSAPIWASVAFTTTPILWQLAADPRIDGFLCLCVILAVYGLVRFLQGGTDVHLKLAAMSLGAALGCKYTALPFVVAIVGIGVGFRLWGHTGTRGLSRLLGCIALLLAVPNAAWYGANLAIHGDPLFPILRGNYVQTPSGERLHISRDDVDESAENLSDPGIRERLRSLETTPASDAPSHLFDFVDMLRNPDRYAVKPHHGIGPLLLISLALPLLRPLRPERRRAALVVWAVGWGGYLLLGTQTNLLRYAVPVLPVLAAATGVSIAHIPARGLRIVVGIAALVLFVRDFQIEQRKLSLLMSELALGGERSVWRDESTRIEWLKQVGWNFTPPMAWVTERINGLLAEGHMPEGSRILMVGEGKGRLLDCDFLPDSSWFAHRFVAELTNAGGDPEVLARNLREQGVTHVLYNREYYEWVMRDTDTARSRLAYATTHLERFLARHAPPLFSLAGMQLFELRSDAEPPR